MTTTNETLTYAGRRMFNGKLVHAYMLEGEELLFKRALLPASVGAHITAEVETTDTGRTARKASYGSGRTVGEDVTRWAALDAAAVGANEARIRATRTDPLMEALGPIRDAYMNATPVERAAILTKVIANITTYGGHK